VREPERQVRRDVDEQERQRELPHERPEQASEVGVHGRLQVGQRRGARHEQHAERADREDVVGTERLREGASLQRRIRDLLGGRQHHEREP
jgi:hypothetical protein